MLHGVTTYSVSKIMLNLFFFSYLDEIFSLLSRYYGLSPKRKINLEIPC